MGFGILFLVLCGFGMILFLMNDDGERHAIIKFGISGFYPKEVRIDKGGMVTFEIVEGEAWPASDPHPEHGGYVGFDPNQPLHKGDSWSFLFDKEGVWSFHDHMQSYYKGKIIVGDADSIPRDLDGAIVFCKSHNGAQCFNDLINRSIKEDGIKKGFELFEYFYATEPEFVEQGCHWVAHSVGEAAYIRQLSGEKIEFTKATAYCGYGFYHGYIQALFHIDPDIRKVQELCLKVGKDLSSEIPSVQTNCFHGIGHGLIDDPPPKGQWGRPREILKNAFSVCPRISEDIVEIGQCYEGAYNGLISLPLEISGFIFSDTSSLDFCRTEPETTKVNCYYEVTQKLKIPNNDISLITPYLNKLESRYQNMAVGAIVAGIVQIRILENDQSYGVMGCKSLPENFQAPCIRGMVGGYFAHGAPEKEYEKAVDYCKNDRFTKEEKMVCFEHIITAAKRLYPRDTIGRLVCPKFDSAYTELCKSI